MVALLPNSEENEVQEKWDPKGNGGGAATQRKKEKRDKPASEARHDEKDSAPSFDDCGSEEPAPRKSDQDKAMVLTLDTVLNTDIAGHANKGITACSPKRWACGLVGLVVFVDRIPTTSSATCTCKRPTNDHPHSATAS